MFDNYILTVMAAGQKPRDVSLGAIGRQTLSFGRHPSCDIVLESAIASNFHGRLAWHEGAVYVLDDQSTNGVYVNGARISRPTPLAAGDTVTFESDYARQGVAGEYGVLLVLGVQAGGSWASCPLAPEHPVSIGRDPGCDIALAQVSVSALHAWLRFDGEHWCVQDNHSTNGTFVGGRRVAGSHPLAERDVIFVGGAKLLYAGGMVYYHRQQPGIGITLEGVGRTVPTKSGPRVILDDVSLEVPRGEFVAIIGGSGAGKSTLMNGMCGFAPITAGRVLYDGQDLFENYEAMRGMIGYVPQQDIVHGELTLRRMLLYTAEMRMPRDAPADERERRVARVIELVGLAGREDTLVKKLSGGQRKRASIAVELVSDPGVFFLDEPTSGLDPGTERKLMHTLKAMTAENKTVVVITHMTLNIGLCDKLIILGTGGKLCFYGTPAQALQWFGVTDFVDIYDKAATGADQWRLRYDATRPPQAQPPAPAPQAPPRGGEKKSRSGLRQFGVLCRRYAALIAADKKRLLLLLLQAPLLALLLCLVAWKTDTAGNLTVFTYSGQAKALLFSLACAAFWVGMLNSVQEICKERDILRRERMTGLGLLPYLASKVAVLGALCLVQSLMLTAVVAAVLGLPSFWGMAATTFSTAFSAMAMGLAVSGLSLNPDRAMTLAPIILMPQILFAGVAFQLSGIADYLSGVITCKWAVRAYCVLADINALPASADATGTTFESVAYTATAANLAAGWLALWAIALVCLGFCAFALAVLQREY